MAEQDAAGANIAMNRNVRRRAYRWSLGGLILAVLLGSCAKADSPTVTWKLVQPWVGQVIGPTATPSPTPTADPMMALFAGPMPEGELRPTPTPDPVREPPPVRSSTEAYIVRAGDSLNQIAARYGVGVGSLMSFNGLVNPNLLAVGQVLQIPAQTPQPPGPTTKLIPDSELVNGPSEVYFDVGAEAKKWGGVLSTYHEEVEGTRMSGADIVRLVADRYSVSPKLLLAMLEFQSGWLTQSHVSATAQFYPMMYVNPGWEGLFNQLSWAANQLNAGFYLWLAGWKGPISFSDGRVVPPGAGLNAGTVGIQYALAQVYSVEKWRDVVGPDGFIKTYRSLFGDPFDWAIEPLLPPNLAQPPMQLPFEPGKTWSFTSGPHAGWDSGSGWAALDFAPPGNALGCVPSYEWVTAVADGLIVRTGNGEVLEDLDGDGHEETGWVVLYMHVESQHRIAQGAHVQAGERLGHPSCEGGVADGTHLHLARKYNGVWISADGSIPFNLDGWISSGTGVEYDGMLTRGTQSLEACACRGPDNQISR